MNIKHGIIKVIIWLALFMLVVMSLGPMLWTISSSFKSTGEIFMNKLGLPKHFLFQNYQDVWVKGGFGRLYINSIIVTFLALVMMITLAAMSAFAISKYNTKLNRPVLFYFLFGQMISAAMIVIPLFLVMKSMGLQDNRIGLSLVYAAGGLPFSVFVLQGFFSEVPKELYDAAEIDGYGELGIFAKVAVPIVKPAIAAVLLYQFLWIWNEFTIAFILTNSANARTLPVGLFTAVMGVFQTNYAMAFSGTVIVSIPVVLIYLLFQKYLIRGLTDGAVKG